MGGSDIDEDQFEPSLSILVDDLSSILDHLGVEGVVYVGESCGRILGLDFARKHPERVRALVLCNTPAGCGEGAVRLGGDLNDALSRSVGAFSTATINTGWTPGWRLRD